MPSSTTPTHHACPFRRILAATDFTPPSKLAFRRALALASELEAELHLVHVHRAPRRRPVFFISDDASSRLALASRLQSRIRRRFEDFLRGEDLRSVPVERVFLEGNPHQKIVAYAHGQKVDLIVIGERPETRMQHLLQHLAFESVGERVRREAPCSVLTVR
jgi:nucleotide-binding universal stress UspA family protein